MVEFLNTADPVEILWKMAHEGELDPWDVDLIDVTDRFLKTIEGLDPKLLARSARCLFYASALVHFKAQMLNDLSLLQDQEDEDDFFDDDFNDRPERIERPLFYPKEGTPLKPRVRRPRGRSLTLADLIDALRRFDAEALAAPEDPYDEDPWDVPFDEDIFDIPTAHEDDLEGDILHIREDLREQFQSGVERISLDELQSRQDKTPGVTYRALLFLANDAEIVLEQEEIYGELFIVPGPEPLREVSEEEKAKRQEHEDRRNQAREQREEKQQKKRSIPKPRRRGRRLSRRPGLSPAPHSRRPKSRRRPPRLGDTRDPRRGSSADDDSDAEPPAGQQAGTQAKPESFGL